MGDDNGIVAPDDGGGGGGGGIDGGGIDTKCDNVNVPTVEGFVAYDSQLYKLFPVLLRFNGEFCECCKQKKRRK